MTYHSGTPSRSGRILVVDDEPIVIQALQRALEGNGFTVATAADGQQAEVSLVQSNFDVLLSDISMPATTGIDLLRWVRQHDLDLPVVLITGSPTVRTTTEAIQLGVFGYLIKPIDVDDMILMMDRAIQSRRLAMMKRYVRTPV